MTPCSAASRSTGKPCKRNAIPGGTVCYWHGGAAPQVAAAAERRTVQAEADALVARLLHAADAEPVRDPVGKLAKVAGQMEHAVEVLGRQVNELGNLDYQDVMGIRRTHVIVEAWERIMTEYRRTLTDMSRLGLTAEALQVARERPSREQAEQLAIVIRAVLADPRVIVEPEASDLVVLDALRTLTSDASPGGAA